MFVVKNYFNYKTAPKTLLSVRLIFYLHQFTQPCLFYVKNNTFGYFDGHDLPNRPKILVNFTTFLPSCKNADRCRLRPVVSYLHSLTYRLMSCFP